MELNGSQFKNKDLFIFNSPNKLHNDGMYDHFNRGLAQIFWDRGSWDKK